MSKDRELPTLTVPLEADLSLRLIPGPGAHPPRFFLSVQRGGAVKPRAWTRRRKLRIAPSLFRVASMAGGGINGAPALRWTVATECCGWAPEEMTICAPQKMTFRCSLCEKPVSQNFGGANGREVQYSLLEELFLEHHLKSGLNMLQAHLAALTWLVAWEKLLGDFRQAQRELLAGVSA